MSRILRIERPTSRLGPIKRRRLFGGVITKANGYHFLPVRRAEVERVGGSRIAGFDLLQLENLDHGFLHGGEHLGKAVGGLPRLLGAVVREVRHVQGGGVLAVGGAEDVAVGVEGHEVGHFAADGGEVGDDAVVHEDVAPEDEGVGVYLCDGAAAAGSDVGKEAVCFGVFAEGAKVEVVDGRGLRLVEGGT